MVVALATDKFLTPSNIISVLRQISINTQRGTTEALAGAIAQAVKGNGGNNTPSPADELMKFKKLHDAGAISDEEFEKAKKKILS